MLIARTEHWKQAIEAKERQIHTSCNTLPALASVARSMLSCQSRAVLEPRPAVRHRLIAYDRYRTNVVKIRNNIRSPLFRECLCQFQLSILM